MQCLMFCCRCSGPSQASLVLHIDGNTPEKHVEVSAMARCQTGMLRYENKTANLKTRHVGMVLFITSAACFAGVAAVHLFMLLLHVFM